MKDTGLNGRINGLPAWAKTIAVIGFPAFVAVFLLAQSAGLGPSETRQIKMILEAHEAATFIARQNLQDLIRALRVTNKIMCQNAAVDERQLRACEAIL